MTTIEATEINPSELEPFLGPVASDGTLNFEDLDGNDVKLHFDTDPEVFEEMFLNDPIANAVVDEASCKGWVK